MALGIDGVKGGRALAAIANSKIDRKSLLAVLTDAYLSAAHRDGLATSCAFTTLAGDVARSSGRACSACAPQVGMYLEVMSKLIENDKQKSRRITAIAAFTLVGAVSMARAVNDEELSSEILQSAANELKTQLG